jgi:hypothetical protein
MMMHSRFPSKQKFSLLNTFIYERPLWGVRFNIKGFRAKSPMTAFGRNKAIIKPKNKYFPMSALLVRVS